MAIDVDRDRARGALLGLACGDALGRPVEFRTAASIGAEFGRVTEMLGDGTHGQPPGTITDDTELALCIARSLVEREAFDPVDIADRFVAWLDGDPFDVGLMTADAIRGYESGRPATEAGQHVWERRAEGNNAGNGSVMRCVPHALAFADDLDALVGVSRQSSAITHADPRCTNGCAVLDGTVARLLVGTDVSRAIAAAVDDVRDDAPEELLTALSVFPDDAALSSSGYVIDTLQTGLAIASRADDAEDAIVDAVSRGDDADTVGAVTGAVVGARFGATALPGRWLDVIDETPTLRTLADRLVDTPIRP